MDNNNGRFGIGFFVGILLGAAAGLFFAPQTGEETRKKLQETVEDVKTQLNKITDKLKQETNQVIEKGKDYLDEKIEFGKKAFDIDKNENETNQ